MATALLLAGRFADKAADLVAATTKAMAEMMVDATKAILELGKEPRREWELWWKRRDFYEKAHLREAKETVVMTISGAAGTSQAGATGVGNAAAVFAMVETATKAAEAVGKLLLQPKLSKPQLSPPHDSSGGRTAAAVMLAAACALLLQLLLLLLLLVEKEMGQESPKEEGGSCSENEINSTKV
mmetsp:Transcript_64989/g.111709  ORF Transcript_64989/g.111709 Transcript_64989/m.111709 type:complete len:184 (-) Transcript_64989:56-607(-)